MTAQLPKPPIIVNRGNSLSNGLLGYYAPGVMGGSNIVSPGTGDLTLAPQGGSTVIVSTSEGPGVKNATQAIALGNAPNAWVGLSAYTVYGRFITNSYNSSGFPNFFSLTYGLDTSFGPPYLYCTNYTSGTPNNICGDNNAGSYDEGPFPSQWSSESGAYPIGAICSTAFSLQLSGTRRAYTNGSLINSDNNGPPSMQGPVTIAMGGTNGQANSWIDLTFLVGIAWGRQLSDAEVATLDANPYALLANPGGLVVSRTGLTFGTGMQFQTKIGAAGLI